MNLYNEKDNVTDFGE